VTVNPDPGRPLEPEITQAMADWAYNRAPGTSARLLAELMEPEPEPEAGL
jgi:hypothetical protein